MLQKQIIMGWGYNQIQALLAGGLHYASGGSGKTETPVNKGFAARGRLYMPDVGEGDIYGERSA